MPKLQAAEFVWDSLGPTLARGSSAVVFQASVEGKPQALRCYIRNDASSRDRYSALDAYLAGHDLSPYVSGTTWLDGAIKVNRATWPVLTMDWIDGRTLNEYVDFLVTSSNAAALTTLAAKWRELVALLQRSEFTHGDLQHGNIMVDQEGRLRLVDFDGVWIPQLAGQSPPTEFGHPNYQHPVQHVWDRWLDTFSALVIYLSLVALGKDPGLWLALYNSKNLLFAKNDFFPPFKTEAWKQLAALGDPQVDELARRLQECCDPDWVSDQEPGDDPRPAGGAPGAAADPGRAALVGEEAGVRPGVPGRASSSRPRSQAPPACAARGRAARAAPSAARPPRPRASRGRSTARVAPRVRAAGPASAVRAARPGGHRTDAATEPDDGAPGRHHLVVRAAGSAPPRVRPGRGTHGSVPPGPGASRGRAARAGTRASRAGAAAAHARSRPRQASCTDPARARVGHEAAAGTGRRRHRARPRDRAPDHRRRQPRAIIVIGGLVAAAWGMWRLVTGTGNNAKPPGQT